MSGNDRDERPRRSWREIDQMRDGSSGTSRSGEPRPRGRVAEARAAAATEQYLKAADKMFASDKGGAEGEELARGVREAHGSSGLAGACRAYREGVGMPSEPGLLSLFLDCGEPQIVVEALEALLDAQRAGSLEASAGLRSQLRLLAEDLRDDVAGAAEDLLELL